MLPILVDLDESSMDNSLALAMIIDLKKCICLYARGIPLHNVFIYDISFVISFRFYFCSPRLHRNNAKIRYKPYKRPIGGSQHVDFCVI